MLEPFLGNKLVFKTCWHLYLVISFIRVIFGDLGIDNKDVEYINVGNSALENLFSNVYTSFNDEWEAVASLLGNPWEGSEVVGIAGNAENDSKDGKYDNEVKSLDVNSEHTNYYKKMHIPYPLGSVKKLYAFQGCEFGTTALVNYSPMKIKTEYSIYLPFGSNLDPVDDKGLTYLMSLVFLTLRSDASNNKLDYFSDDSGSVTVSEHYTKITILVPDSDARESLTKLLNTIGLGNDSEETVLGKEGLITTKKIFNSLLRLYYLYKSCLRDENYRIKYLKSASLTNTTGEDICLDSNIGYDFNSKCNSSNYYEDDKSRDSKDQFHFGYEQFSDKWEGFLSNISISDSTSHYILSEDQLDEEEKKVFSPEIFEWIAELKETIVRYFRKYWKSENMSLFIDSSLDIDIFEEILGKRLAISNKDCEYKKNNYFESNKFGNANEINYVNKYQQESVTNLRGYNSGTFELLSKSGDENFMMVLNVVPLYYKLSIMDIDFKIKMNNIAQMISVTLSKVMDLIETLYVNTVKKRLLKEELIRDLSFHWNLHFEALELNINFRLKLDKKKSDKVEKVIEGFRSFSEHLLGLIRKNKSDGSYEVSRDLINLVDEMQRLYEVNWHSQYVFDDEPTILTTPLDVCGIPTQMIMSNENIHSNWIKREVRLYNFFFFKAYPNLILHSIHRSYVRFPGECKQANDCNLFRLNQNKIAKEPLDTGNNIYLLLEFIINKINEFEAKIVLTDPYFRYKTKYEIKLKTYNQHEYMNLHFNFFLKPKNTNAYKSENKSMISKGSEWQLPNLIVNLEHQVVIPEYNNKDQLILEGFIEDNTVNPKLMYNNALGFAIKLENFRLHSPLTYIRSVLRTKLDVCEIYKYVEGDSICYEKDLVKRHSKLAMIHIIMLIINNSIERFLESEPFEGYNDILSKLSPRDNKESKWRDSKTLSKPFHFGSLKLYINTIELNFIGPECSLLSYIDFLFVNLRNNFKPLNEDEFYILLKELMENEIKQRKNRSSIDYIRYYQGIFQYDDVFMDDIFIYTGIYIKYEDYLAIFNYIMNNYLNDKIHTDKRKIGYMETLIFRDQSNSDNNSIYKEYTELIQTKLIYKEASSYKYFCLNEHNYVALTANDEPIIIRQATSDRIMGTSSASIRFQLPCNWRSLKYEKYNSSSDFLFKDGNNFSQEDETGGEMNREWITNDGAEPRCIFNTVASRILERILRKHINNAVNKAVEELVYNSNNDFIRQRKSNFNIKGEAEVSFYKLNSIPQFTIYILSTNFDTFTLLSILRNTLDKLKVDVIENQNVLTDDEFSSVKNYFVDYYCTFDNIQIRNIRLAMFEMNKWRYNFNWKHESCQVINDISKEEIISFFNDYFVKNSPYRRSFILLVQGPPFKQLISHNKGNYDQSSMINIYHNYILSLIEKETCAEGHGSNSDKENSNSSNHETFKVKSQNVSDIDRINNYSYPNDLKTDRGILSYKENKLGRYQPRCSNFVLDIFNTIR